MSIDIDENHEWRGRIELTVNCRAEDVRSWQYGNQFGLEATATGPETALALATTFDEDVSIEADASDWMLALAEEFSQRTMIDYLACEVGGCSQADWARARAVTPGAVHNNIKRARESGLTP